QDVKGTSGLDIKWSPLSGLALDGTVKPDFSQVESDAAQLVANERFALSFPEKRSFFLEGGGLFSTPFTAVYTRAITAPDFGARGLDGVHRARRARPRAGHRDPAGAVRLRRRAPGLPLHGRGGARAPRLRALVREPARDLTLDRRRRPQNRGRRPQHRGRTGL